MTIREFKLEKYMPKAKPIDVTKEVPQYPLLKYKVTLSDDTFKIIQANDIDGYADNLVLYVKYLNYSVAVLWLPKGSWKSCELLS